MADETRSRLGRGLAALIGDVESGAGARGQKQRRVPVEFLKPNPRNPRRIYDEGELDELARSIRERGIIQPIVVRPLRGSDDSFEIIAGERRWRAAQRARLDQVPIVVLEVSDGEAMELAIIENVQRTDLNPLEEATGYQILINDYKHSHEEVARIVGKSRSHIGNTLRLLKLPESVKTYINAGKISAGHARALVGHDDPEALAREIVEKGLNVRQIEARRQEESKDRGKTARARKRAKDANTQALEKRLADRLGLVVSINHGSRGGVLRIKYRTLDQLDDVVHRLESGGGRAGKGRK
jgi:ParB family chromosome partitioning protein